MTNAKLKAAYDLTPCAARRVHVRPLAERRGRVGRQLHRDAPGQPTFAGQAGFASGFYASTSATRRTASRCARTRKRDWDVEAVASRYRVRQGPAAHARPRRRRPTRPSAPRGASRCSTAPAGRRSTCKGAWHRGGPACAAHASRSACTRTSTGSSTRRTTRPTGARGGTTTRHDRGRRQDAHAGALGAGRVALSPELTLTVGGRYERWRAFDGYNANGATQRGAAGADASTRSRRRRSLAWTPTPDWTITASRRRRRIASRRAAELYQLVSTGPTFTSPDPNLKPDDVLAAELRVERRFDARHGAGRAVPGRRARRDHLAVPAARARRRRRCTRISRTWTTCARAARSWCSADRDVLVRGLELSRQRDVPRRADARAVRPRERDRAGRAARSASACRTSRSGARTSRRRIGPIERLALTVAGRYSGKLYTTLDNADVRPNTYQGFSRVVRGGRARALRRSTGTGRPRSASTTCSIGSTSCSIRSRSARSSPRRRSASERLGRCPDLARRPALGGARAGRRPAARRARDGRRARRARQRGAGGARRARGQPAAGAPRLQRAARCAARAALARRRGRRRHRARVDRRPARRARGDRAGRRTRAGHVSAPLARRLGRRASGERQLRLHGGRRGGHREAAAGRGDAGRAPPGDTTAVARDTTPTRPPTRRPPPRACRPSPRCCAASRSARSWRSRACCSSSHGRARATSRRRGLRPGW